MKRFYGLGRGIVYTGIFLIGGMVPCGAQENVKTITETVTVGSDGSGKVSDPIADAARSVGDGEGGTTVLTQMGENYKEVIKKEVETNSEPKN